MEQFKIIAKKACTIYISDILNERFKSALEIDAKHEEALTTVVDTPVTNSTDNIETTEDETMAFMTLRSILSEKVDIKRITMRDAQSYCAILLDDNNRKPLCRLFFTDKKKAIGIVNETKEFIKADIQEISELYSFKKQLFAALALYESK